MTLTYKDDLSSAFLLRFHLSALFIVGALPISACIVFPLIMIKKSGYFKFLYLYIYTVLLNIKASFSGVFRKWSCEEV